jgi:hypothetical protein
LKNFLIASFRSPSFLEEFNLSCGQVVND